MRHEDKVVVLLTPQVLTHESGDLVAARFRELGLSTYAQTEDSAVERLRLMYASFVHHLRRSGTLEQRLSRAKVTWYSMTEYEQLGREYEDLTLPAGERHIIPPPFPSKPTQSRLEAFFCRPALTGPFTVTADDGLKMAA